MADYIEIDFQKVKGFSKLSEDAKKLFIATYQKHNDCFGFDNKEDWVPVKVVEHKKYLEVHFKNGNWLHYTVHGTWY